MFLTFQIPTYPPRPSDEGLDFCLYHPPSLLQEPAVDSEARFTLHHMKGEGREGNGMYKRYLHFTGIKEHRHVVEEGARECKGSWLAG